MTIQRVLGQLTIIAIAFIAWSASQQAQGQEVVIRWKEVAGASGYTLQIAGVKGSLPMVVNSQTKLPEFRWSSPPYGEFAYRVATISSSSVASGLSAFSGWTAVRVIPPAPSSVKFGAAVVTEPEVAVSTSRPITSETSVEFQLAQSDAFGKVTAKLLTKEPKTTFKLAVAGKYWVRARFCSNVQKLCTAWSPAQSFSFVAPLAPKKESAAPQEAESEGEEEEDHWDPVVLSSRVDVGLWGYLMSLKQSSTTAGTQHSSSHSLSSGGGSVTLWPVQPVGLKLQTTRTISPGGLPKGSMSETSLLVTLRLAAQVMPFAFSGAIGGRSRTFPVSVGDEAVDRAATIKTGVFDAAGLLQITPKVRLGLGLTGDFDAPGITSDWKSKGEQSFGLKLIYFFTPRFATTLEFGAGSYSYFTSENETKFYTRGETIFSGLGIGYTF